MGLNQLHTVESFLVQALAQMLKAEALAAVARSRACGRLRRGVSGVMLPPGSCLRCGNGSIWQIDKAPRALRAVAVGRLCEDLL